MPGDLRIAGTHHVLACVVVNVSVGGMCVQLCEPIVSGGQLELMVSGQKEPVPLVVVYCRPAADAPDQWTCGLKLPRLRVENLLKIFMDKGCVDL